MNVETTAFFIGFFADLLLNYLTRTFKWNVGLLDYFKLHKTIESAFIAAGLMFLSMWIGLRVFRVTTLDPKYLAVFIFLYGCVIDNFFRYFHWMPTLNGMYEAMTPIRTMFWAGGPLLASLLVWQNVTRYI